jgi:hypothetical protein
MSLHRVILLDQCLLVFFKTDPIPKAADGYGPSDTGGFGRRELKAAFATNACFVWALSLAGSERNGFFFIDYPPRRFTRSSKFRMKQTRTWSTDTPQLP